MIVGWPSQTLSPKTRPHMTATQEQYSSLSAFSSEQCGPLTPSLVLFTSEPDHAPQDGHRCPQRKQTAPQESSLGSGAYAQSPTIHLHISPPQDGGFFKPTTPLSSMACGTLEDSLFPALCMASQESLPLISEDRWDKIKDTSIWWEVGR